MLSTPLRSIWLVITLTSITAATWANSLTNDWQSPAYIEKAFSEIALKNEYRQTDGRVIKWQQPIYYQYQYYFLPKNDLVTRLTDAHLAQLKNITKHPIQNSNTVHPANFKIIFTKDRYYQMAIDTFAPSDVKNLSRESHCMGTYHLNKQHEIVHAAIIIPVDHAMSRGLLPACIVEEITQVMGLPNDSDWVNPSIANDKSRIDLLTGLDYIMLKLLYSPDLKAGMNQNDIQPIVRRELQFYQRNGLIRKAGHLVNKAGLYPLLN